MMQSGEVVRYVLYAVIIVAFIVVMKMPKKR